MTRPLASLAPLRHALHGLLGAASLVALGVAGCGEAPRTGVDESGDLGASSGGQTMAPRVVEMPIGLDGTQWRWTGASCTEGPLDLAARGFSANLRIEQDGESLLLTYDRVFAKWG